MPAAPTVHRHYVTVMTAMFFDKCIKSAPYRPNFSCLHIPVQIGMAKAIST
jgi:hypothetical protein